MLESWSADPKLRPSRMVFVVTAVLCLAAMALGVSNLVEFHRLDVATHQR